MYTALRIDETAYQFQIFVSPKSFELYAWGFGRHILIIQCISLIVNISQILAFKHPITGRLNGMSDIE